MEQAPSFRWAGAEWLGAASSAQKNQSGEDSCGICTNAKVALRTRGNTTSSVGNAIAQDKTHEPNQSDKNPGARPTPRKVLTRDTTQVMMTDKKNGMTRLECRVCNKGMPKGPRRGLGWEVSGDCMPRMVAQARNNRGRRGLDVRRRGSTGDR
jgi:hypothetical protein